MPPPFPESLGVLKKTQSGRRSSEKEKSSPWVQKDFQTIYLWLQKIQENSSASPRYLLLSSVSHNSVEQIIPLTLNRNDLMNVFTNEILATRKANISNHLTDTSLHTVMDFCRESFSPIDLQQSPFPKHQYAYYTPFFYDCCKIT